MVCSETKYVFLGSLEAGKLTSDPLIIEVSS